MESERESEIRKQKRNVLREKHIASESDLSLILFLRCQGFNRRLQASIKRKIQSVCLFKVFLSGKNVVIVAAAADVVAVVSGA